eukprot:g28668.t1
MGFFEPLSSFMKTPEGQNMYIICFTLVGGLEGYLLTMAYRYVGDAIDVPGLRRQSASRLLSLLGVLAVNPFSFTIGERASPPKPSLHHLSGWRPRCAGKSLGLHAALPAQPAGTCLAAHALLLRSLVAVHAALAALAASEMIVPKELR